ncbi:MFS transporter [Kamptonema animale CS-326]|jgi:DHA3 family macrolide efflux protein-like MFS transporter|uniref:MFS transporter n=1 Tax=Kamptonema animale TaxID=92934 RepID=UPI00232BB10F|nr:MFS transporter [Kamptonema animale]MDB9510455.1 MFS transporter [Kamptonema animale CS-326]
MQTFIIVWLGQTASIIGSAMSSFGMTIWVWQLTNQVTALALFGFFTQLSRVLMAPIAGVIVDRINRKLLMMTGDAVAGLSTLAILFLYLTHNLQIWHLYVAGAVNGIFEQIQQLAFSAAIATIVPQKHYSRASSVGFLASYGSSIIAPALAGTLYYIIGLAGILAIDLMTFAIAIATILLVKIPQPPPAPTPYLNRDRLQQELSFGFRYIAQQPSLIALLASTSLFWFAHDIGAALYSPMILARTGNDAQALGQILSAAGIGGVIGASAIGIWGGPKRRIRGFAIGIVGAGLSKTVFGLGQMLSIWIPAQVCSSLNFPLLGSSSDAIWLTKVKPEVQGRVFAARAVSVQIASTIGLLIAGPLADRVFEPGMKPGGWLAGILGGIFGTGAGAGMALLYAISAIALLLIGLCGYNYRPLRDIEKILPDFGAEEERARG